MNFHFDISDAFVVSFIAAPFGFGFALVSVLVVASRSGSFGAGAAVALAGVAGAIRAFGAGAVLLSTVLPPHGTPEGLRFLLGAAVVIATVAAAIYAAYSVGRAITRPPEA